jgi:hypothetical protein
VVLYFFSPLAQRAVADANVAFLVGLHATRVAGGEIRVVLPGR